MNWSLVRRPYTWFRHEGGSLMLLQLALIWLVLACAGSGLASAINYLEAGRLAQTALLALLSGWLLSRSRLPGWRAGLAAAGIGILWLALTVGQVGRPLWELMMSGWPVVGGLVRGQGLSLQPVTSAWAALAQGSGNLADRLALWAGSVGSRTAIVDPMMTGLLWGLALWLASIWAAWWTRRRGSAAAALAPAGALLALALFNAARPGRFIWLVFLGGGWLLVQGLESYLGRRRFWQERRMDRSDVETPLTVVVSLLAIGLMLTGGILPTISIERIRSAIDDLFPDRTVEGPGSGGIPGSGGGGVSGIGGRAEVHTVGPGIRLSSEVVMYVSVEGYVPLPPPDLIPSATIPQPDVVYYWRAQSYEHYNGHVWSTYARQDLDLGPGAPLDPGMGPLPADYKAVRQQVERVQRSGGILFVAGELLSASEAYSVTRLGADDLVSAQTEASIYSADSRLPYMSEERLRQAGTDYPALIQARYLQLPEELPQRVRDLAITLTLDQSNPYDKAAAIQNYLRQYTYTLEVPAPPSDRDVADYFLFDLQRGYCEYYATTMVVLARAAGVPARMVLGYSTGSYDENIDRFVVRQLNAHAWVEVFFPEIGWVQFEPTAIQPLLPRPGGTEGGGAAGPVPTPDAGLDQAAPLDWSAFQTPLRWLGVGLAAVLVSALLPLESWFLLLLPADRAVPLIYRRLYRRSRRWGVEPGAARTPHEFARAFAARLDRLAGSRRLSAIVQGSLSDLDWLTGLYTRAVYSQRPPSRQEGRRAIRAWRRLRRTLRRLTG